MSSKLTKQLYTDITRLKLLDKGDAPIRFRLQQSPFSGDDDEDITGQERQDYKITGQIFPNSEIFNVRSYLIELELTKSFPFDPPIVHFLTPIYHPNVEEDGKFCSPLLNKVVRWIPSTSLTEVVKVVVANIDKPNMEYPARAEVAREFIENPDDFKRHALECVKKHGLPR